MMKFKSSGGEDFKRVPAGAHLAICNLVADVGIQPGTGAYPDPKHKIYVRFETPNERVKYRRDDVEIEGPLTIGKFYTASMSSKANLRKDLEGWRGKKFSDQEAEDFDVSTILGKPCMLSVVQDDKGEKTYSNIVSISGVPKGMPAGRAENPLLFYGPDDQQQFNDLPEWLRKKIETRIIPPPTDPRIDEYDGTEPIGREDSSIPF